MGWGVGERRCSRSLSWNNGITIAGLLLLRFAKRQRPYCWPIHDNMSFRGLRTELLLAGTGIPFPAKFWSFKIVRRSKYEISCTSCSPLKISCSYNIHTQDPTSRPGRRGRVGSFHCILLSHYDTFQQSHTYNTYGPTQFML